MKAIIPVAGFGNRLRPHTFTKPKVLLPVAGKPILGHILDRLQELPIEEFIFITGYLGEMIRDYVRANYRFQARFIHQDEQLGLGHAISLAAPEFGGKPLLIVLGDTIFDANLSRIVQSDQTILCTKEVKDPSRFGVAVTRGKNITRLVEKPKKPVSKQALVGIYFVKQSGELKKALAKLISNARQTSGEYQLTDALQAMLEKGVKMQAFPIEGWFDCGKPETVLQTNRQLLKDRGPVAATRGTAGSVILPPVYVDPKATVRDSIIGPFVSVGAGTVITRSVISESVVGEEAHISNCSLHQSMVGNHSTISGRKRKLNVGDSSVVEYA